METNLSSSGMADKAHAGIEQASSTAHDAVSRAADVASVGVRRLAEKRDQLTDAGDQLVAATRGYVRDHPVASVGIALGVGFLLSRLWRIGNDN
jgi:ElaB/YqjD/DUF883 family membrane-anchored ribosome-binding protein